MNVKKVWYRQRVVDAGRDVIFHTSTDQWVKNQIKGWKQPNGKRLLIIYAAQKLRHSISFHSDLSVTSTDSYVDVDHAYFHHIDNVTHVPIEEEQRFNGNNTLQGGRIIVELGVLAEWLSACKNVDNLYNFIMQQTQTSMGYQLSSRLSFKSIYYYKREKMFFI